ncbi:alpha/beta fold hydrolase [Gemmatimonadota bacterium]
MTEESMHQTIVLQDGRRLGFAEYGDAAGKAVFHFNGSGGSRLEHPSDLSILTDLGIRLISTDRPGHGISDPQPGRTLLDWPDDISQLADHLGIDRFYVMGWSAGGPHALACAKKLPDRVVAGAIISGLAPPDRPNPYEGLPFGMKALMIMVRRIPPLVYPFRRLTSKMLQGDPAKMFDRLSASFPPEDIKTIEDAGSAEALLEGMKEGFRQGGNGPAQDDILINSSWGFRLDEIQTRFDVWQGEVDRNVPMNQGEYQHELLPDSRLTILSGQAHLYLLTHWREVLDALVT